MIQFYFVTVVTTIFSTFCFFKLLAYMQIILLSKSHTITQHLKVQTLFGINLVRYVLLYKTFFMANLLYISQQHRSGMDTVPDLPLLFGFNQISYVLSFETFSTTYSDPVCRLNHSLAYSGMASVISFRCFSYLASTLY